MAETAALTMSAQREAARKFAQAAREVVEKLEAAAGQESVGDGDKWFGDRLATCVDDWVYDLAVEVRKAREGGAAWWRLAHDLNLPGCGASSQQGRGGAAFARRAWRAAWGRTYVGTAASRETKEVRVERVVNQQARPYFAEDAEEMYIIRMITGAYIQWVARLQAGADSIVTSEQDAYVHGDQRLVKVKLGPQGRYVEFFEQADPEMLKLDPRQAIAKSGPLRSVYLDRITKVGA